MNYLALFFLVMVYPCFGKLSDQLKSHFQLEKNSPIESIDAIYLINLDNRPKRFEACTDQLKPYGINPYRFSAINGWKLLAETFDAIGLIFNSGMQESQWIRSLSNESPRGFKHQFLTEKIYKKPIFSKNTTPGCIGCTLSHLSILQQAYDAGFETIWILEDDIVVMRDPHLLDSLIKNLDQALGKRGWDILCTDPNPSTRWHSGEEMSPESDISNTLLSKYYDRPDIPLDLASLGDKTIIDKDFMRIRSRMSTHSMIVRRSGMKKILDFEKNHKVFLPYDLELAVIPDLVFMNLREPLVTTNAAYSDTQSNFQDENVEWEHCKKHALFVMNQVSGCREENVAKRIMDFIAEKKPQLGAEIGAFGGSVTYPIACALKHQKSGLFYAIDPWDCEATVAGLDNQQTEFWKGVNFSGIFNTLKDVLAHTKTEQYCRLTPKTSKQAADFFDDAALDFVYIDGNESSSGSLEDVQLYFPKVKKGGYIWLNRANDPRKFEAVGFLMERATWLKDDSLDTNCILFQK